MKLLTKNEKPRIIRVPNNLGNCVGCVGDEHFSICKKLPKCAEMQNGKLREFIFIYKKETK